MADSKAAPAMVNRCETRVGRLLETRIEAGFPTLSEVHQHFNGVAAIAAQLPARRRFVIVGDWRRCPAMSDDVVAELSSRMTLNNTRIERSCFLTSRQSPISVMQILRAVGQSGNPNRRVFYSPADVTGWLRDILSPAEFERLERFLEECSAPPGAKGASAGT